MVIHRIAFEQDGCFEEVASSLIRIVGDSTEVVVEGNNKIYVMEKVRGRLEDGKAGYKWKKSKSSVGNKLMKSINKKDNYGNRLRCRICNSFWHLEDCCEDK